MKLPVWSIKKLYIRKKKRNGFFRGVAVYVGPFSEPLPIKIKYSKFQISNFKQISMIKIRNSKPNRICLRQRFRYKCDRLLRKHENSKTRKSTVVFTWLSRFRSLMIVIWDLFVICCLIFGIYNLPVALWFFSLTFETSYELHWLMHAWRTAEKGYIEDVHYPIFKIEGFNLVNF